MVIEQQLSNYSSYTVNLAWLKSSTTEPQQLQYFKLVFLILLNVPIRTVFAETVTYASSEGDRVQINPSISPLWTLSVGKNVQ